MREELVFWGSVAVVAIVAIALFKLLAASPVGSAVPAVRKLGAFV